MKLLWRGRLAEKRGDAGAEAEEAAHAAGGIRADARWRTLSSSDGNAHGFAEQVRINAVGLPERVEARELLLQLLIGERDLILLRLARIGLRLLAAELRESRSP